MKPTCCENVLHKRQGQLAFHFLIHILKHVKEIESFIFCGIKTQSLGIKKDIVCVSYITNFEFLAYNSLYILKAYGIQKQPTSRVLKKGVRKICSKFTRQIQLQSNFIEITL